MILREQKNAVTKQSRNNSSVIKQSPSSSSRDIHDNLIGTSELRVLQELSCRMRDPVPAQVDDGMMMLTFSDARDFNQLKVGLCQSSPQFYAELYYTQALHEYACALSLKLPQFSCSGRHCFGKDPQCSPYLLQVVNPSFLLSWLGLLARH